MRLVADGTYRAGSWDRGRRVLYKAEVLEKDMNTRFVVTSRTDAPPEKLYDWYVKRGEAEGWIKDFKRALKAERLSCHRFLPTSLGFCCTRRPIGCWTRCAGGSWREECAGCNSTYCA